MRNQNPLGSLIAIDLLQTVFLRQRCIQVVHLIQRHVRVFIDILLELVLHAAGENRIHSVNQCCRARLIRQIAIERLVILEEEQHKRLRIHLRKVKTISRGIAHNRVEIVVREMTQLV